MSGRDGLASAALVLVLAAAPALGSAGAYQLSYEISREYVRLDVQKNATVFVAYNLTVRVVEGRIARFVRVGMPKGGFDVVYAYEVWPDGWREVDFSKIEEGDYYAVEVHPSEPIEAGESRTFLIEAAVPDFVYEDETNPGNVGLEFSPSWFEDAPVRELRLSVLLPEGVGRDEVRNQPDYDNVGVEDGRLFLYWERRDLSPGEVFTVGVSFPAGYMERYAKPGGGLEISPLDIVVGLVFFGIIILSVALVLYFGYTYAKELIGKLEYEEPWFGIEALGAQENLLPAEVVYLSELERPGRPNYGRLFSAIVIPMVVRGVLRAEEIRPLKLEPGDGKPKYYYERLLLKCVEPGDGLRVPCAARVVKAIHRRVEDKMAGFSRKDTLRHYEGKIADLWREVREARPEDKVRIVEENIDWLIVDKRFGANLRRAMRPPGEGPTVVVIPRSGWWWFGDWGMPSAPTPTTAPTPTPRPDARAVERPAGGAPPPPVGTAERGAGEVAVGIERVADGIASSVERFSSSVARSVEGVADRVASLVVPRSRARSARRARASASSCVCACVSCACACACVSCACACAGGGAG